MLPQVIPGEPLGLQVKGRNNLGRKCESFPIRLRYRRYPAGGGLECDFLFLWGVGPPFTPPGPRNTSLKAPQYHIVTD